MPQSVSFVHVSKEKNTFMDHVRGINMVGNVWWRISLVTNFFFLLVCYADSTIVVLYNIDYLHML